MSPFGRPSGTTTVARVDLQPRTAPCVMEGLAWWACPPWPRNFPEGNLRLTIPLIGTRHRRGPITIHSRRPAGPRVESFPGARRMRFCEAKGFLGGAGKPRARRPRPPGPTVDERGTLPPFPLAPEGKPSLRLRAGDPSGEGYMVSAKV